MSCQQRRTFKTLIVPQKNKKQSSTFNKKRSKGKPLLGGSNSKLMTLKTKVSYPDTPISNEQYNPAME